MDKGESRESSRTKKENDGRAGGTKMLEPPVWTRTEGCALRCTEM